MTRKHGPWTIKNRTTKFQTELIEVVEDEVTTPDGRPDTYAIVKIKAGCAVLAVGDDGHAYFAREFRYAVGHETLEVVNGAIDEGEAPAEAARRELREELGIEAEQLIGLGRVDPAPSLVDSPSNLFLALGLKFTEPEQDESETIRRVKLKLGEAVRMALGGDLTHGPTCVLILRADYYLKDHSGDTPGQS